MFDIVGLVGYTETETETETEVGCRIVTRRVGDRGWKGG